MEHLAAVLVGGGGHEGGPGLAVHLAAGGRAQLAHLHVGEARRHAHEALARRELVVDQDGVPGVAYV